MVNGIEEDQIECLFKIRFLWLIKLIYLLIFSYMLKMEPEGLDMQLSGRALGWWTSGSTHDSQP